MITEQKKIEDLRKLLSGLGIDPISLMKYLESNVSESRAIHRLVGECPDRIIKELQITSAHLLLLILKE